MKKILFILCLLPVFLYSQQIDTVGQVKSWTDTTVTITYKILHTYTLKKTDISEQITRLTEDSVRMYQDRTWWLDNWGSEMTRIRSEKRRLKKLLN